MSLHYLNVSRFLIMLNFLAEEILENRKLLSNKDALNRILCCLRKIGSDSLATSSHASNETNGFRTLKKVLQLYEKMATSDSPICRSSIVVPDELHTFFQRWKSQTGSSGDDAKMYLLIDFIVDESSVPEDVLGALVLWTSTNNCGELMFSRLRALLCRGVHYAALKGDLSGTLLRLKHARTTFKELILTPADGKNIKSSGGIWDRMAEGDLSIDK
jgi:hypothetical protein